MPSIDPAAAALFIPHIIACQPLIYKKYHLIFFLFEIKKSPKALEVVGVPILSGEVADFECTRHPPVVEGDVDRGLLHYRIAAAQVLLLDKFVERIPCHAVLAQDITQGREAFAFEPGRYLLQQMFGDLQAACLFGIFSSPIVAPEDLPGKPGHPDHVPVPDVGS